ncbi:ATP-binding protein [Bradyrhizobium brasilense]|uniref:ATP-binding protein n=1 Tax=Bradyrhizobium brasilense TaxID=1419277 RepID=UPI001E28FAD7|nr:ATP-binding protein [Bradyrhizobium brasilense]MCC8971903.1 ATP-binding protein [Bradyrhizobium brasilense]
MAKRTIQDSEIALIKAMLDRGMKNKDIQFYFNRPERSVNSGRISTIRTGAYSNSGKILAASAGELDSFIERFASHERNESSPIDDHDVRKFFRRERDSLWYLHRGESEECECKQDFDPKKLTPVVRAIAALANNKGGYVFFGVGNNQCRVDGAGPAFSQTDIVDIINKVKAHLAPTPSITAKGIVDFDGKAVGFLRVDRHPDRPVIVYRDGEGLSEGDILYRYAGQSSRIKFADLRSMLEERDRRAQVALAKAAGALADVGTANAIILDIDACYWRSRAGEHACRFR